MTIGEIISEVKLCCDENDVSLGTFPDGSYEQWMYAQISQCARHALCWLASHAPYWMLDGSDESSSAGFLKDLNSAANTESITISGAGFTKNTYNIPAAENFVRLVRGRLSGWHRSVEKPIEEWSGDYLALHDPTSTATIDRPQVAIIRGATTKLEFWPCPSNTTYDTTYVTLPLTSINALKPTGTLSSYLATSVAIPPKAKSLFVYYTAYLFATSIRDATSAKLLLEAIQKIIA